MSDIKLIQGDCLEKMKDIPDGSVDMVLCDLPYGTTACSWDSVIPFDKLWEHIIEFARNHLLCMGSGTTGCACKTLNSDFIGIELDPEYFKIAEKRINENL